MKVILTSPDALIDHSTGAFFDGIEKTLDNFLSLNDNNKVITVSIHKVKLSKIPTKFNPTDISDYRHLRGSPKLVEIIKKHFEIDSSDLMILGAKKNDVYQAANSKLLLLTAKYAEKNNPDDIIYKNNYGIQILFPNGLALFFKHFYHVENPWYFKAEISSITTIYSLTNANTLSVGSDTKTVNTKFRECLKDGKTAYRAPFAIYFLVCIYRIFKEIQTVDYWGIYPSSNSPENPDLDFFLVRARQSFGKKVSPTILIRTEPVKKRHELGRLARKNDKCDSQLETIIINPYYKGKLQGKHICIIDDFTTYGSSCETVRNLLESAGVAKITFITMGKFGTEYNKYNYKISEDIFSKFKYQFDSERSIHGEFNSRSNREFLDSIKELL